MSNPTKMLDLIDTDQPDVKVVDLSATRVYDDILENLEVPDELLIALEAAHAYAANRGDEAFVVIRIKPTEV